MRARYVAFWATLVLVALVSPGASANEQAPTVKESPLASVRAQLTHYDLEPPGTLALLPVLAKLSQTLRGPEAAEAAFLRAAAANDLLFLAQYLANDGLRSGLAAAFGVAPDGVAAAIAAELAACAHGVYREPAQVALAALQNTQPPEQPPVGTSDLRRDARLLHAATTFLSDEAAGARFAALAADPCTSSEACPAAYAELAPQGRRAFVYLQQLSAAAARLERTRGIGDPLFEALAPVVARDIATLRAFTLRLPLRIPGDPRAEQASPPAWPAPNVVVFARATELTLARAPRVRIGLNGQVEQVAEAEPATPARVTIAHNATDGTLATRGIDEVVTALRAMRAEETPYRALLVVDSDIASLLSARVLVSLRKAGASELLIAVCTKEGALVGAQVRVVIPSLDGSVSSSELKLRVRLGGYSLDVGRGVTDIPRVRDESGLHFDLTALRKQALARAPRSAAVSFMPDVATEHVLLAMSQVAPAKAPIDLVIQ